MGLFDRVFGRSAEKVEVFRLEVLMDYNVSTGTGWGALRWVPSTDHPDPPQLLSVFSSLIIGRLYGRILAVHAETRAELFARVGRAAERAISEDGARGIAFDDWTLNVGFGGGQHCIWPWRLTTPEAGTLYNAKVYSGRLFAHTEPRGALSFALDMSLGMERVLAPSSVLIALACFGSSGRLDCLDVATLLLGMNDYYQRPDRATLGAQVPAWTAAQNERWLGIRRQKGLGI